MFFMEKIWKELVLKEKNMNRIILLLNKKTSFTKMSIPPIFILIYEEKAVHINSYVNSQEI